MMQPSGFTGLSMSTLSAMGVQGLTPLAGCTPSPSSTTDVDQDGVYANATVTFSCSVNGITVTGSMSETDHNDNDASSGYTITVNNLTVTNTTTNTKLVENLSWDLTKTGTYSYALNFDLKLQYTDSSGGNFAFEDKGKPTYTADPPGAVTAYDPFVAGTFTFSGSVTYTDSDGTYALTRTSGQGGVH
ncbi:MAG: hypothetical protein P8099_21495, partial [Gemmatimonadota bacterium]